jgi:tRNA pseudouridine13 synthase
MSSLKAGWKGTFEEYAGIEEFRTDGLTGFLGIQKQRFSDFIVQEVVLDPETKEKKVAKLTKKNGETLENEMFPVVAAAAEDFSVTGLITDLSSVVGADASGLSNGGEGLAAFLEKCRTGAEDCEREYLTELTGDKAIRSEVHKVFKNHASGFIDTSTKDGKINLVAKHKATKAERKDAVRRSYAQWPKDLPQYLRFTLLKQNCDTQNALGFMQDKCGIKSDRFGYAGVKDKRGVTTQWITLRSGRWSQFAEKIARMKYSPALRFGDFEYVNQPHKLGDLYGNRFGIILRELDKSPANILANCEAIKKAGFINYYGLQRFGKGDFGAKTSDVGREIFRKDFKKAIDLLFTISYIDKEDFISTKNAFNAGNLKDALRSIPRGMGAEKSALQALFNRPGDYEAAVNSITKRTRLMYVHAYQSLLWNKAASERVRMGNDVLLGDLVINNDAAGAGVEAGVEITVGGSHGDMNNDEEKEGEGGETEVNIQRKEVFGSGVDVIHVVTADDISKGRYSMADVLLPVPGHQVQFPTHSLHQYYLDMLTSDGLDLTSFETGAAQYRMSGVYRRLLQYPEEFNFSIKKYADINDDIISTEFARATGEKGEEEMKNEKEAEKEKAPTKVTLLTGPLTGPKVAPPSSSSSSSSSSATAPKDRHALHMEFTLRSGSYATMMIREMTRDSTDTGHQAGLTEAAGGRGALAQPPAHKKARLDE